MNKRVLYYGWVRLKCVLFARGIELGENFVYVCIHSGYCIHGELDFPQIGFEIDTAMLDCMSYVLS